MITAFGDVVDVLYRNRREQMWASDVAYASTAITTNANVVMLPTSEELKVKTMLLCHARGVTIGLISLLTCWIHQVLQSKDEVCLSMLPYKWHLAI